MAKLKCTINQYLNNKIMKITSSSEISKTIYHNGRYLLLFGTKNLPCLEIYINNFCYFQIKASSFKALPSSKLRTSEL